MPRINFLFVLMILLTACAPNATLVPMPTVASSPVVTETAKIDVFPAGIDRAPTDPSRGSSELFVLPTIDDAKKLFGGTVEDVVVPKVIADEVAEWQKIASNSFAKVAEMCVVPEVELSAVFVSNDLVGDDYRWGLVLETNEYICWSSDLGTQQLGEYPTYFDGTTKTLKNAHDGVSFERINKEDWKPAWAGTIPVLVGKNDYILPGQMIVGTYVDNEVNWNPLAESSSTGEILKPIDNPIAPESMALLTTAGYRWDAYAGVLKNIDGQYVISLQDGKWVDLDGKEWSKDALSFVDTTGTYFDGSPIVTIPKLEENGELRIFGPISKEWIKPIDIASSQDLMDQNALTNPTFDRWGDFRHVTFDGIPTVTQNEAEAGALFDSEQIALRVWSENVREPLLQCVKFNTGNYWRLTQYPLGFSGFGHYAGNTNRVRAPGETPILWENDGIRNVSVVKYRDEVTREWIIKQGRQYWVEGNSVVLHVKYWGKNADPNDPEFINTQLALTNPPWNVVEPWCNESQVRPLLPKVLQQKMAEEDINPTPPTLNGQKWNPLAFDIDNRTMSRLQQITFEDAYMEKNLLEFYLRPLSDEIWKQTFPDMPVLGN